MSRVTCLCIILFLVSDIFAEIQNKGWWQNTVFYAIYPRSFKDSNNDGIGDLKGITSKISYFVESGIGGIWLSPIYASPMKDLGYDISDFKDVHPDYGTMQDLKDLIAEAKSRGIKVIMDLVPNHTSDKHEWFKKSVAGEGKYRDYYIWRTGKEDNALPPNNWISVRNTSAWTATNNQWYLHQFDYRQPDLNYNNPEVNDEMEDVIRFWLRKGIDGFHVHGISHLFEHSDYPNELPSQEPDIPVRTYKYLDHIYTRDSPRTYGVLARWRSIMDDYANYNDQDEKVLMVEADSDLRYVSRLYTFGSQVPFNLKFVTDVNHDSTARDFKRVIEEWIYYMRQDATPNWIMGGHDRSRLASRFPGKADQMIMLQMVLPGVAVTYYGEEIGMVDKTDISCHNMRLQKMDLQACRANKNKYDRLYSPNRTPFQWDNTQNAGFSASSHTWLPVHENYRELNLLKQQRNCVSHYKIYTALTKLRRDTHALYSGGFETYLYNNETVLVVVRHYATERIIFLMNFDQDDQTVDLLSDIEFPMRMIVKITSLNSSVRVRTRMIISAITVPSKAALILVPDH